MVRQVAWVAYWDRHVDLQQVATARVLDRSGATAPAIRAAAAAGVGPALARQHTEELVAIVDDEADDAGVRAECLFHLRGRIDPERLAALCTKAYRSDDRRLRHTAVNTMRPGPHLTELLEQARTDPDFSVRYAADSRTRWPPQLRS